MSVCGHVSTGRGVGGWLGVAVLHNFGSRVTRKSCCFRCFFFLRNHVQGTLDYPS